MRLPRLVTRERSRSLLGATLLGCLVLCAGCNLPEGETSSPEGLFFKLLSTRQSGDWDGMWELLHPDARGRLDRWVEIERKAAALISAHYPEAGRQQRLALLTVAKFKDGRELFRHLARSAKKGQQLGFGAKAGAHVRSVDVVGDQATIRTWAGDQLTAIRGADGRWYTDLDRDDDKRLDTLLQAAEQNLRQVERTVVRLQGLPDPHKPSK